MSNSPGHLPAMAFLLASTVLATPSRADDGGLEDIHVEDSVVHYAIAGSHAQQLRDQMRELGPTDPATGERAFAYTKWTFNWSFRSSSESGQCRIASVAIEAKIEMTMPEWSPAAKPPAALTESWNTFLAHLLEHENGHRQIALDEMKAIRDGIRQVPAQADCKDLGRQVGQAVQHVEMTWARKNAAYDRSTNHGETQGAVF